MTMFCLLAIFTGIVAAADPVLTAGADFGAAERIACDAEQKLLQSLHNKIKVQLTDASLEEAIAAIANEAAIQVWLDKGALQEEGIPSDQEVTLNLGETTVWQALHFLLRPLGLTWEAPDGVLVVTTQAGSQPRIVRVYDVSAIVKVLEPQFEGDRPEDALAKMLQTCSYGTWSDMDQDGGTISILRGSLIIRQNYQTHLEIQALLQAVENILVLGAKAKSLEVRRPGYPFDEDAALLKRLREPITIDARDQSLDNLFQSLGESRGFRYWFDRTNWVGIPTETTVSVTRSGTPLDVVLKHLLQQLGLAAVIHEGTLVVTPESAWTIPDLQSILVYNTAEIASGNPEDLVSAIEACAAGKWELTDGEGGAFSRLGSGLVVVRQSQAIHGVIANMLDELHKHPAAKHDAPAAKLEQRLYPVADATAVADLVRTLPQLIPNWDGKQGSIHRLGQSVLVNQPAVVHTRVSDFIAALNAAHASLQAPQPGPLPIAPQPVPALGVNVF